MMKVSNVILAVLVSTILTLPAAGEPSVLKKCQICHGKKLEGKKKNPSIIGLTYESLLSSLTDDVPKKMRRVAEKLTAQEKEEISRYITTLNSTKY